MNRQRVLSSTFLCLLFCVACADEAPPPEPIIRPVRSVQVYMTGGERVRSFSGTARAGVESRLSFKVTGTVRSVGVAVGDVVRAGQLLVELDDRDYRLQVQEAEAALKSAQAQTRNAQARFTRAQQLYQDGNASRSDLDAARAGYESANQQAKSGEKRLQLANSQLSYTRLLAPLDGSIAALQVEANENVGPGQAVILLNAGARLEVEVAVPEMLIAQVREGSAAQVRFDALGGRVLPAKITEVGVASTSMATTFSVAVRLEGEDAEVRPGMAAEVDIRFGRGNRERIYVPPVAIGEDRSGRFAYIVEAADEGFAKVHRRAVSIGELTTEGLEVLEGLQDGERVVTAGISRITDGQRVRLMGAN